MENGDFVIVFLCDAFIAFFCIVFLCCAFLTWCDVDALLVGSGWLVPCVFLCCGGAERSVLVLLRLGFVRVGLAGF